MNREAASRDSEAAPRPDACPAGCLHPCKSTAHCPFRRHRVNRCTCGSRLTTCICKPAAGQTVE